MRKRHRLGQHFLTSQKIAQAIIDAAGLGKNDIVFEIGTGKGILTPMLCKKAKKVISVEADRELYNQAKENFSEISNLELICGNGFRQEQKFTVFVSNLPYSQSRKAVEWLLPQKFDRCVVMVQDEFAEKLFSVDSSRKAISVLAQHTWDIKKIIKVGKANFVPPPKVDSVVLHITRKKSINDDLIKTVNKIFSYRRKTVQNILKQFGIESKNQKRLDELDGDEIIKIAKQILK